MPRKAKETPHLRLRVEKSLLARLEKSAEKGARTLTGEIVHRLQQSYETDDRIEIFRAAMTERLEEARHNIATLSKQIEEDRVEARRQVEERITEMRQLEHEFRQLEKSSEEAFKAAAVVDVLLGENKLKSELLRSIALELAEAPDDWLSNVSSRRQIAERVVSRFETGSGGTGL
jgi:hypothetical protein